MVQASLSPTAIIAQELKVNIAHVEAGIRLLDEGDTVPFIARYRKEVVGLDSAQLRFLEERLYYIRDLNERREVILNSIREQGKLTPELEKDILLADTKTRLEDLYLPHRPKRRTKAALAKEAGLEPLADALLSNNNLIPEEQAESYVNAEKGFEDVKAVLEGAKQILMERFAEEPNLVNEIREYLWQHASIKSTLAVDKKSKNASKYADYFDYKEPLKKIRSHRALALLRARREGVVRIEMELADAEYGVTRIASYFNINQPSDWLKDTLHMAWKVKVFTKLELELLTRLREQADDEAIQIFARNLRDLLLAAPAGPQVTIGLDPGIRTGVKVIVVDATGKVLDYTTVFPFAPQNDWHGAIAELARLAARHNAGLISIGNGTGSRDTERLVAEMMKMYADLSLTKIVVSEAGASVYSASKLAEEEFPDLDVSIRGAVSIARRLQDPLAELVKIEPKSIGVGQYQHDVNQQRLSRSLTGVVEDCVNTVGVDVNTASVSLLTRVAGLNETVAKNIVSYRNEHGAFNNRTQFKDIPRMGEKCFQQCAGFLRIMNGENSLDSSAVHPEAYPLVEKILTACKVSLDELMGNSRLLKTIDAAVFVDDNFGLPTVNDVLQELEKPGRDPRPEFKTAAFKEGIEDIKHLAVGMILEGVVSNVTNFGAFVDIGVHQDGLVHISAMTDRFITDPHSVVKAGDIIQVRVVEVDQERRRIGLSMKLEDTPASTPAVKKVVKPAAQPRAVKSQSITKKTPNPKPQVAPKKGVFNTAMADALSKLKRSS